MGTINIEFRTVLNKTAEGSMGQAIYNGASLDYTNNLHVKYDQVSVPDDKKPRVGFTRIAMAYSSSSVISSSSLSGEGIYSSIYSSLIRLSSVRGRMDKSSQPMVRVSSMVRLVSKP